MNTDDMYPKRKQTRLKNFDYNNIGAYFVTICTENRQCILSNISRHRDTQTNSYENVGVGVPDDPFITLTSHGKIVEKYIFQLNDFYKNTNVNHYVIMPNHIHLLIEVYGSSGTPTPTDNHKSIIDNKTEICRQNSFVAKYISTLKRFCNKEFGTNIWQRNYYDHVIRNMSDYNAHVKYIHENPINWYYDELYME